MKLDAIYDVDGMGSTDFFDPSTIPTDGSDRENTRIHARQSRVNLDARGPSPAGTVRAFVEGDFYGSGNAFRLRHGYGTVGGLLGGQTWTTFMDEDALPPTLDFEEPQALVFERVAMLRWTQRFDGQKLAAIAVEQATGAVSASAGTGTTETPWPFVTARARKTGDKGHVQLSGFFGSVRFRPTSGSTTDVPLWGVNASVRVNPTKRDQLIVQGGWGEGTAAYRNGVVAAPDGSGDLVALPEGGATLSYRRTLNERYSAHGVVNYGYTDNSAGQAGGELKATTYAALNLVRHLTDRAWIGVEYLYGEREDKDGSKGQNHRIQISTKVDLI